MALPGSHDLKNILHFWRNFICFRRTKTLANKASRHARRAKYESLLCEAEHHAATHNTHQLYRVIRRLAPKQKFKKVQICAENGHVLSKSAEALAIRDHFQSVFQGHDEQLPHVPQVAPRPFEHAEILRALERMPATKATPPHYAPGVCWKAAAGGLADILCSQLPAFLNLPAPKVPQPWKDGWLALLGKPAKCGRRPGDFRPICVQDPTGKAMISVLASRIRPAVQAYASVSPQHAYLPHRSTDGALLGIFERCRLIRTRCQEAMPNIQNKRYGHAPGTHPGGLVLSLDMSSAFDIVPRLHIFNSLVEAGVEDGDVALVMEWLSGSQYHFRHGQQGHCIHTNRGVRQGCVLSPLLWACFTCYILRRLPPCIDPSDVQAYAVLSRCFSTHAEFQASLQTIPAFLQHLRSYGLKINTSKTVLLLRMATPRGKADSNKHITHTKRGVFFRVPGIQPEYLPIRTKHVYLGCVISLFDFEADTLRHRVQVGRTQFQRLRPLLCSNKYMSLTRRTRLWHTCVWSSISYGLACCGLPSFSLKMFQRAINLQLRSIARLPSHITHVTTEELYVRLGLQRPELQLQALSEHLCGRLQLLRGTLPQDDVMCRTQLLHQAEHARDLITESAGQHRGPQRLSQDEGQPCPHCGLYFQGLTAVKIHIRRKHPDVQPQPAQPKSVIHRHDVGVDGMPTCRHCGHVFGAWKDLMNHISRNQCHATTPVEKKTTEPQPVALRRELVQTWIDGGAERLLKDMTPTLRDELRQRCCLCRQWIASPNHIKAHIRRSHPEVYNMHFNEVSSQCSLLAHMLQDPCPFCLQTAPSKHRDRHAVRCPVLVQVALCCRQHGDDGTGGGNRLSLRGVATSLPGLAAAPATAGAGHGNSSGNGGGRQKASEMAEAKRKGRTTTATVATRPKSGSILEWMPRVPQLSEPGAAGNTADAGSVNSEAGGRHQRVAHGSRVLASVQDSGPGDRSPHVVRDSNGLAPEESQQPGRPSSTHRLVEKSNAGDEDKAGEAGSITRAGGSHGKVGLGKAERRPPPSWLPLAYDQETKQEVQYPNLGPMEHSDVMKALEILFSASQRPDHATVTVPGLWQLSTRGTCWRSCWRCPIGGSRRIESTRPWCPCAICRHGM